MTTKTSLAHTILVTGLALAVATPIFAEDKDNKKKDPKAEAREQAAAKIDQQYGFRGLKFDTSYRKLRGFKVTAQSKYRSKRVRCLVRVKEDLKFYHQRVRAIRYYFYKGKLFEIEVAGYESFSAVTDFAADLGIRSDVQRSENGEKRTYAFKLEGEKVIVNSAHYYFKDRKRRGQSMLDGSNGITTFTLKEFAKKVKKSAGSP